MPSRSKTTFLMAAAALSLAACRGGDEQLPPVFGAVFGVSGAAATPFSLGTIPEPVVGASDRLVGTAANSPGLCIFETPVKRRLRAACPEGFVP